VTIFAIDPGNELSAWVRYDGAAVLDHGKAANDVVLQLVERLEPPTTLVIEQIESFGMPVGREVFETVFWAGRFAQASPASVPWRRVTRKAVKLHLCQTTKAKDPNIRQALLDRFGGATAIGRKANKGPLYGLAADEWQALGVAVTWFDTHRESLQPVPPVEAGARVLLEGPTDPPSRAVRRMPSSELQGEPASNS
jgi:hypothetical protein